MRKCRHDGPMGNFYVRCWRGPADYTVHIWPGRSEPHPGASFTVFHNPLPGGTNAAVNAALFAAGHKL